MIKKSTNRTRRTRRHIKVRGRVRGTAERPRIVVFRSLLAVYAQIIDDVTGKTLVQANLSEIKKAKNNLAGASEVGKLLGERAQKLGVKQAVFDRSGYKYHGRVKALADGAREAGLIF
ncbi:MAG: 50S ribosomal protein L18 [Candidatus Moraniibacteriota bacterium]